MLFLDAKTQYLSCLGTVYCTLSDIFWYMCTKFDGVVVARHIPIGSFGHNIDANVDKYGMLVSFGAFSEASTCPQSVLCTPVFQSIGKSGYSIDFPICKS